MPTYTETDFEDHIEQHLNQARYRSLQSAHYDKSLCLIPSEMLRFIQMTQLDTYHKLEREYGEDTPQKLMLRISNQVKSRGVLDVLRKGVKDRGCDFTLTYFLPSSGMNPDHQERYAQNRFSLISEIQRDCRGDRQTQKQDLRTVRMERRRRKICPIPRLSHAPKYQRRLHTGRAAELHNL